MTTGQRLAEIIQAFCADALSPAVNLNVDLDVVLCVLPRALTAAFRQRLPGNYAQATPHTPPPTPPSATQPPRRHHRPLVGRTSAPLRIRLTQGPRYRRGNPR